MEESSESQKTAVILVKYWIYSFVSCFLPRLHPASVNTLEDLNIFALLSSFLYAQEATGLWITFLSFVFKMCILLVL